MAGGSAPALQGITELRAFRSSFAGLTVSRQATWWRGDRVESVSDVLELCGTARHMAALTATGQVHSWAMENEDYEAPSGVATRPSI